MTNFLNYQGLCTETLLDLHNSIKKAMKEDDLTQEGQDKKYGVREFTDWKEQANKIERELDSRQKEHDKIDWTIDKV